ncbi:MAG: 4Fe-4S cluster-binding domain-containing protein, partial [Cytophagales bacterium]|nr:4Fe-4S cluster-binding domain-containing protein [Cytophagales bacterium]
MNNYDQQIITSSNKNNYFIDENEDLLLLCHPAMKKIIHSGTDHLNTLSYYKKKYQFLKKHGFFKNFSRKQVVEGRLNVSNFEEYIANSRQVIFETTEKCNLKCTYCAYGLLYNDYRKRKRYNLPIEKAELLIDFLAKKWNSPMNTSHKKEIFVAFYGGEPLLNINFIKAVVKKTQRLRLEHNTFNYAITTNGTQLHKHMSFFVQ